MGAWSDIADQAVGGSAQSHLAEDQWLALADAWSDIADRAVGDSVPSHSAEDQWAELAEARVSVDADDPWSELAAAAIAEPLVDLAVPADLPEAPAVLDLALAPAVPPDGLALLPAMPPDNVLSLRRWRACKGNEDKFAYLQLCSSSVVAARSVPGDLALAEGATARGHLEAVTAHVIKCCSAWECRERRRCETRC